MLSHFRAAAVVFLSLMAASAEDVSIPAQWGEIKGTLEVPSGVDRPPVMLIISGSGPTDRDGNSALLPGKNNGLRYLAEGLSSKGVASLRYDKRGIGKSVVAGGLRESELRFDDYVADAKTCVRFLKGTNRFGVALILGHSEGAHIGLLAATDMPGEVAGYVSLAGSGRRACDLIREQLKGKLPPDLAKESERILSELNEGRAVKSPPPALAVLYRESVQPYMISWFKHDPAVEIARLGKPILIAQGSADIQVGVADAERLHAAAPASKLIIIDGMNHVLKDVGSDPASQADSYKNMLLPVSPRLVEETANFAKSQSN